MWQRFCLPQPRVSRLQMSAGDPRLSYNEVWVPHISLKLARYGSTARLRLDCNGAPKLRLPYLLCLHSNQASLLPTPSGYAGEEKKQRKEKIWGRSFRLG
jgi:hypothetical protein